MQAAGYVVIGIIFSRIPGASLGIGALYSLAIVAMTPSLILSTVAGIGSVEIPQAGLFYLVTNMAHLFFAIKATQICKLRATIQ